jgi:hypothetical protein
MIASSNFYLEYLPSLKLVVAILISSFVGHLVDGLYPYLCLCLGPLVDVSGEVAMTRVQAF